MFLKAKFFFFGDCYETGNTITTDVAGYSGRNDIKAG